MSYHYTYGYVCTNKLLDRGLYLAVSYCLYPIQESNKLKKKGIVRSIDRKFKLLPYIYLFDTTQEALLYAMSFCEHVKETLQGTKTTLAVPLEGQLTAKLLQHQEY